jgi:hypothetical protein
MAVTNGNSDLVSLLLTYSADQNLVIDQRKRHAPLMVVVMKGHKETFRMLVHGTESLNRTRALGFTVAQGNRRIAEVLRSGAPSQFCPSEIPKAEILEP